MELHFIPNEFLYSLLFYSVIYGAALSGVVMYNYLKMRESRANSQPSADTIPEKLKALLKVITIV
jgi:hypothetical protein